MNNIYICKSKVKTYLGLETRRVSSPPAAPARFMVRWCCGCRWRKHMAGGSKQVAGESKHLAGMETRGWGSKRTMHRSSWW
jgi:hypothetical protein